MELRKHINLIAILKNDILICIRNCQLSKIHINLHVFVVAAVPVIIIPTEFLNNFAQYTTKPN